MATVEITLQPWDNYPRPFSVWENQNPGETPKPAVVSDTLSEGHWTVTDADQIWIQWGGWFNASHHHEGGHVYRVNVEDCVPGEKIDIGYVPYPGKQDSIVLTCVETSVVSSTTTEPPVVSTTAPPPSSTTAPEPPTSTSTAPVTTAPTTTLTSASTTTTATTEAPPATLAPSTTSPGALLTGATTPRIPNGNLPCVSECGIAGNLPNTGVNSGEVITGGITLVVLGAALWLKYGRWNRTRRRANYLKRAFHD